MKGVQRRITRSHVYSFAISAVRYACVYRQELTATKNYALAITTGRPKKEAQNAHES
ncbi:hypothetical protein Ahy_A02g008605 [Arachis hypogaea]|uniref:Uncharacterized protein n=1 Tax=Arachis hypogaea TaxID=3818 RepID=A0A445EEQ6_ARAHY|nr:hypothetical protein Ahy_A02g008605 [Arachis hypogaea]